MPIEIYWENLTITAAINKKERIKGCKFKKWVENKVILDNTKGILRPGSFTAILGPSGKFIYFH